VLLDDLTAISCVSPSDCVVAGVITQAFPPDDTTISTTDGGTKWTETASDLQDVAINGLSCTSTTQCVLVGGDIWTTSDFGGTWTSRTVPTSPQIFSTFYGVSCGSSLDCVAVGDVDANYMMTTTDGGTTWVEKEFNPSDDDSLDGVSCTSASDCIAVGIDNLGTNPGAVEVTTNGGTSWTNEGVPLTSSFMLAGACWSATACIAVGNDATKYGSMILASQAPVTPLKITTTSLASGKVGKSYSVTMKASGGTKPYTWKVSAGTKPGGLSLSSAGVWSGKPTKAGTYSLTVKVTAKVGGSATKALKFVVAKA
jgi:photosystem II stability/assembly factor-like uncharacterized protein